MVPGVTRVEGTSINKTMQLCARATRTLLTTQRPHPATEGEKMFAGCTQPAWRHQFCASHALVSHRMLPSRGRRMIARMIWSTSGK